MIYLVKIYKNNILEYSNSFSTYDGALSKARQWLEDGFRKYKYKIEIIEL